MEIPPEPRLRYFIVAAGTMSATATRTPVFNGLAVVSVADGLVTMRYDGYAPPKVADDFQTIVKVLPVFNVDAARTALVVNFLAFRPEGFVIRVTDVAGAAVPEARLRAVELMVEVSQYIPLQ